MKKIILTVLFSVVIMLAVLNCGGKEETKKEGYELALITDIGTIDDRSFNQGAWEGLKKYAEEKGITYRYYQPKEKTTDAYVDAIDLAVSAGAKVVITPGFLFEPAVFRAQDTHKDVNFILLDGTPQDGTYKEFRIEKNVYSVFYAEQESGFLAGYAAVKDGYRKLGFVGGMAVPAVIRYGYGFVEGADYAAKELGLKKDEVSIKYTYVGNFSATPENQTLASSWYKSGTQIIFACGGAVGFSVMAAADQNDAVVIGVDVDQSKESPTVVTSAMKELANSVYDGLVAYYGGTFPGGQSITLDAKVHGVALPMATSKFKSFTQADYDAIYKKLVDGQIKLSTDKDVKEANKLPVGLAKVELVK